MGTSPENTLTNFDLDLLLCPTNTSLSDYGYQTQNMDIPGSSNHCYQDQNIGITDNIDHSYQIQNMENIENIENTNQAYHEQNMRNKLSLSDEVVKKSDYEALKRHFEKLYMSLQNNNENLKKDYDALKKQYAKIALDYANLHEENKEHAMTSLNVSTKCDNLESKEVDYLAAIDALKQQCQKYSLDIMAQGKQFLQYDSHVEDLVGQINNLKNVVKTEKNNLKTEKNNVKECRKIISNLNSNIQKLTEHLCLFGCVIDGRKTLNKDSRRFIKKYCKKITSSKKSMEAECFESQSIDTGRGSSLALSDSDRSFYSPSYSITSSPFSIGTGTTQKEQAKIMRDASSSPLQMIKTIDISTSPIIFEKGFISAAAIKKTDVATMTMLTHEELTLEAKRKTIDIATSPVKLTDAKTPIAKAKTCDISPLNLADTTATSLIEFADTRSPVPKVKFFDIATSPIQFVDARPPVAKEKTLDIATSPIKFADARSPVAKARTLNIATSPIQFCDARTSMAKEKTLDIATSPIQFVDARPPVAKEKTLDIATSPIKFADARSPVAKARTLNIATSPIQFCDARTSMAKEKTLDIATSPIKFADLRSPVVKARTLNIPTSPIQLSDARTPMAKEKTLDIATSPIQFADATKSSSAKARTLDIATSPIKFAESRPLEAKMIMLDVAISPILLDNVKSPVAKKKTDIITSPIDYADTTIPVAKKQTKPIKTLHMTSPIKQVDVKSPSDIIKTPGPKSRSIECANVTTVFQPKRLHSPNTENLEPASNKRNTYHKENRVVSPVSASKCVDLKTSNVCHMNKINEKLKEIVSKQIDLSQDDAENDWEIKMILSKHCLSWDMLSPISLTPEIDQENEKIQSENQGRIDEAQEQGHPSDSLAKSLQLSDDEYSEDDIESEDCHVGNLVIDIPQHLVNSDDAFNLMKGAVDNAENYSMKHKNSPLLVENVVSESLAEVSDENTAKSNTSHVISTKYKKLTKLQKIYKANTPKSKIKNPVLPYVKKQKLRPKSHSISPVKYSQNKEKDRKLKDFNLQKKQLFKKPDAVIEVFKERIKYINKEPQSHPESQPISIISDLPHNQSNPSPESDLKKRACTSTETQLNSASDILHPPSSKLLRSGLKRTVCMSTKTLSNIITGSPHTQTNQIPNQTIKTGCLPSESPSNSKYEFSKLQTKPECRPSFRLPTELPIENYYYPKPINKRIARIRKDIPSNPVSHNKQVDSNHADERISFSEAISHNNRGGCELSQLKRPANNSDRNNDLDVKRKKLCISQEQTAKTYANIEASEMDSPVSDNKNSPRDPQSSSLSIRKVDTLRSQDDSNIHPISLAKTSLNYDTNKNAEYNNKLVATQNDHSPKKRNNEIPNNWTQNILDSMIYKYGSKPGILKTPKHLDTDVVATIIKAGVDKCVKRISKQDEYAKTLQELADELKVHGKQGIISGLVKFLNDPARKPEFIPVSKANKEYCKGPTVSKPEMALIDVIELLEKSGTALWDLVLDSSEFILFTLERGATPCFDVVESVAHFYAHICKYRGNMSRMWMFMLNAMYCLSFKAIPVLKQCLDVVPEVLPYADTYLEPGRAPLIRCFIFLLHFYNCEDRFKRIDVIRRMLKYKYQYSLQDENETTLLFFLKESIVNLADNKLEREMLELSLLIVAKRRGTKWCHKNIVQKIILPMIQGEIEVSYTAKRFCITTIGHIMKPYNNEMTVHCEEVVNLLIRMFEQSQSQEIKEDIISGLINMNMKTISDRLNACLFNWNPPSVSPELEDALKRYVHSKSMKNWQNIHQTYYKEI